MSDVSARILARMSVSVSVLASWNPSNMERKNTQPIRGLTSSAASAAYVKREITFKIWRIEQIRHDPQHPSVGVKRVLLSARFDDIVRNFDDLTTLSVEYGSG